MLILIFATTTTEITTDMCFDGSSNDDWPLYLKDDANRIDLPLSLIVDFADMKKVVEEHNKKRNLDIDSIRSVCPSISLAYKMLTGMLSGHSTYLRRIAGPNASCRPTKPNER